MNKSLKIGVVGATGMVGQSFISILEQQDFEVSELRPFASEQSLGKTIRLGSKEWPLQVLTNGCFRGLDIVFFSSGDDISKEWAPRAVADGAWAVDNSAAFRMDPNVDLVVPEVNGDLLKLRKSPAIIANPNCSTIQLVVALNPLYKAYGISDVKVASYQAVSGAGLPAYEELLQQTKQVFAGEDVKKSVFPHQIAFNCIPQIGSFMEDGFTSEENKVMRETNKIMRAPELKVSAFTVRVPVLNSHAECVWVTLNKEVSREEFVKTLSVGEGLVIQDNVAKLEYPLQSQVSGQDPVYVGRIRQDRHDPKTWLLWIVSDNIRKGAALNGMQIAEQIFDIR